MDPSLLHAQSLRKLGCCRLGCSPRLWSRTAESSTDVQRLPLPLLGSCTSILQLCKRLTSSGAQNGCLYPTFPSETPQICTNPSEPQRCDAELFSARGFADLGAHCCILLPCWPRQSCTNLTVCWVQFVLIKLYCQSIVLDLDLRLGLL